ncbi:hypothetical protein [Extensimonas sp. H3M7-6]|jgi:hypothetical protein|uniref:hypothetical protein n=1 Tax=Extensimonas soli TaxID=3031322 RepID=UPI0023D97DE2|nr:hypothetical protein [Extensimonas sp. H3M7-6]MDF1481085.1 hypothetical protein [Extensimonas sp. H3M7-6]
MRNTEPFSLDQFALEDGDQIPVPVAIPHNKPFRIHPDVERTKSVYLSRAGDEWWLIARDVVAKYRVPRLWQADLYQGIYENGNTFILPVTHPLMGYETWYSSLSRAVKLDRKDWISIESDREQARYNIHSNKKRWITTPEWPDDSLSGVNYPERSTTIILSGAVRR